MSQQHQQNSSQPRSQQQQQQQHPQGQPTSYPSPRSYPSPSMSAYAYPPPQQQQTVEPYRASPTGSHVSLPNLNLPPLRAIDPRHPQQGHAHAHAHAQQPPQQPPPPPSQPQPSMGSPLPPPVAPMAYYHNQPPSMPSQHHQQQQQQQPPPPGMTSSPHHQPLRYPLPATEGRILSGGRHKKEIKRRTKTGCLTCRKRRIKCDEGHPTCRNCQKSKRECLGYDPIFKAQLSPAAIQPAPSSAPSMSSTPGTAGASGGPAPYPPAMQHGYQNAVAGQFATALSAGASSPGSSVEPYDYSAAIDPALEAAGPAPMGAPPQAPPAPYDTTQGFRPDLKRGLGSASPYSSAASDTQTSRGGANPTHHHDHPTAPAPAPASNGRALNRPVVAHTSFPAKSIKIDDLLRLGGSIPPPLTPPTESSASAPSLAPAMLDQIKHVYLTIYGNAIDQFLETTWYHSKGLSTLLADPRLCELFASLIERFAEQHTTEDALAVTQALEARVVWMLMCLCRAAAAASHTGDTNGANTSSDSSDVSKNLDEALRRLRVFENLLTSTVLDSNPADLSRISSVLRADTAKFRQLEFWRLVGRFLTLRDNEASSAREIDDVLTGCRTLLDNHENRDIIYSAAVVRHVGARVAEFPNLGNLAPAVTNDEKDSNNKLRIAKTFIENEAAGSATTTVLGRLCDLIIRSWTVGGKG